MYKLKINHLVDKYFPTKSEFARAIHKTRDAAVKLCDGTTTRIEFDTLTALCKALHCTPNDILIDDDASDEDKALAARLNSLSKSIPNFMNIQSKEDERMAVIANKLILYYLCELVNSSDPNSEKILDLVSKNIEEWKF